MKRRKRSDARNCAPNTELAAPELARVKGGVTAIEYGLVASGTLPLEDRGERRPLDMYPLAG
jgi:hypothetical protein